MLLATAAKALAKEVPFYPVKKRRSYTDEMERRLRSHVMETENVTPAPTSKSFFPNRTTIRNHMRNAEKTKQTSIDDETNLESFLSEDARRKISGGGCNKRIITRGECKEDNHKMRMQGNARRIITGGFKEDNYIGGCKEDNHMRRMQGGLSQGH
ncbi:hypothetical protein DPMN_072750 [Dreissena polymorpha]|uniref:Uncharacterized protein n=1 Tax=Dreissena polymorpha TaxID=45954 RepID=A0A9D4BXV3_DREPO|nr:hypothetical protein DPMN_072750 [Dreissena polymorpha]